MMAESHYCVNAILWLNATMDRKPQNQDKFVLRLPDGMRDKIRRASEASNRSMNAEIVMAIDYWLQLELPYLQFPEGANADDIARAAAEVRKDFAEIRLSALYEMVKTAVVEALQESTSSGK